MSIQPKKYYTEEEYLALERAAEYKSEFYKGEIFAMSGASKEHAIIVSNILVALHHQLRKKPCTVHASDSLKEYILVSQDEVRVEAFCKQNEKEWSFAEATKKMAQLRFH